VSPIKLRIFQLITEATIPLYGIFIAHWSFSFLIYFFLFDLIFYSILECVKIQKATHHQTNNTFNIVAFLPLILLSLVTSIMVFIVRETIESTTITESFSSFFFTKEMGIPQGLLLLPLLFLAGFQQYKLVFVKQSVFTSVSITFLKQTCQNNLLLVLASIGIALFLFVVLAVPGIWIMASFVILRMCWGLLLSTSTKQF
jgi:hypothetical protein